MCIVVFHLTVRMYELSNSLFFLKQNTIVSNHNFSDEVNLCSLATSKVWKKFC